MRFSVRAFSVAFLLFLCVQSCKHEPFDPIIVEVLTNDSNLVFGPTPGACDPDTVYFERDVLPLIANVCGSCHKPGGQNDGILLTNYDEIMQYGEIRPGNPGASELYEVITETDLDKRMPPPPASVLAQEDIDMIRKWIEQGAQNNTCNFDTGGATGACNPASVSFANEVSNILSSNGCTGCHSGGSIVLNNYAGVKTVADNGRLLGSIKHEAGYRAMPDGGGKLDSCDIVTIEVWINEGVNDN